MTLEIVFVSCLLANPKICVVTKGPFEGLNPGLCYNTAQQKIADYLKDHDGWYVAKYGCQRQKDSPA